MEHAYNSLLELGDKLAIAVSFGPYRDQYPDHYENGIYMTELTDNEKLELETTGDKKNYILHFWDKHVSQDEKYYRGLVELPSGFYMVKKPAINIFHDSYFTEFYVCYDFTNAVAYSLGKGEVLVDNNFAGYDYPLNYTSSMINYINNDGTYIVQLTFKTETRAFVLMKSDDKITIVHHCDKLIGVKSTFSQLTRLANKLENHICNKDLLELYFDCKLTNGKNYSLIGVDRIVYYDKFPTYNGIVETIHEIADDYFLGRPEYVEL